MYDIHDFKDAMDGTPKSQKKSDETQMEKKFPLTQLKTLAGEYSGIFSKWTQSVQKILLCSLKTLFY